MTDDDTVERVLRAIVRAQPDVTDIGRKDIDENWPIGWADYRLAQREAARAAIAAHDGGWQPIETAPRDKTHILGVVKAGVVWLIFWRTKEMSTRYEAQFDDGWTRAGYSDPPLNITHWQPLPPPPKDTPWKP